jgi:hypothetical protein
MIETAVFFFIFFTALFLYFTALRELHAPDASSRGTSSSSLPARKRRAASHRPIGPRSRALPPARAQSLARLAVARSDASSANASLASRRERE